MRWTFIRLLLKQIDIYIYIYTSRTCCMYLCIHVYTQEYRGAAFDAKCSVAFKKGGNGTLGNIFMCSLEYTHIQTQRDICISVFICIQSLFYSPLLLFLLNMYFFLGNFITSAEEVELAPVKICCFWRWLDFQGHDFKGDLALTINCKNGEILRLKICFHALLTYTANIKIKNIFWQEFRVFQRFLLFSRYSGELGKNKNIFWARIIPYEFEDLNTNGTTTKFYTSFYSNETFTKAKIFNQTNSNLNL